MKSIESIKQPVLEHLKLFDKKFKYSMKSSVPLLDIITNYILKSKGKQIRPLFVFFSAGLFGKIENTTYTAASLIELLHTASLIHDDVVDDSNKRRGFFSINALWKNKIAVLVGDYLLSKGLLIALENGDIGLLKIVSESVKLMSEGELLQIEKARKLDIQEDVYFEIIRCKTASLIASCCACGAASVGASEKDIRQMNLFGENVGIAFQLKDDLFDYQKINLTGKPSGSDLKEQKFTLPLIFMLNQMSFFEKRRVVNIIKNHHDEPRKILEITNMVLNSGGIEYAENRMKEYQKKALDVLIEYPDSIYKESLIDLVNFTIERNH